jgi:elongation factor Tu
MEIRDLLSFYEYDGTMDHIQGSALGVNNDPAWVLKILELMEAVDAWIEEQDVASLSYLLNVFSITGRGTVATGHVKQGC